MIAISDVSRVALGCWPIAGITSIGVTESESCATIAAAFDAGINHFDTAHAYGYEGESERLVGEVLAGHRDEVFIATKGGLVWGPPRGREKRRQTRDGRPETILAQFDESLKRLHTDHVDLYYLHAPDPQVPLADQAVTCKRLLDSGKARYIGVSNFQSPEQYDEFAGVCPIHADQQPYNMLQRQIEESTMRWTRPHGVPTMVYWPLMKGLLAGRLRRDHVFDPADSRRAYDVFQGEKWNRAHNVLDRLREIAAARKVTVAQLVVAWTAQRSGVGSVLCGAKRPDQIRDTAVAMHLELGEEALSAIDAACVAYHM